MVPEVFEPLKSFFLFHFRAVSPLDPAGAIYSSATDMSKWMVFHLNNGRNAHGRRLVNDTWLNQTYEPQMALPFSPKDMYKPVYPVEDAPASYGLGWITSTYRGKRGVSASILTNPVSVNSLTTKKQTTKLSSANFLKMLFPSYIILRIQRLEGKQCRSR